MRKTLLAQQTHLKHDQLILNYKQQDSLPLDSFLPVWNQVWSKFQIDICSYFMSTNHNSSKQTAEEQANKLMNPSMARSMKHTFSFAYSVRQLKRVITMHSNMDVFTEIRKQTTKIFYRIAHYFVVTSFKINQQNLFESIVEGYYQIQSKLSVLIGCLNLVLNKFITRKGIQQQIYTIIYKELINHHLYQNYVNSCILAIQTLRNQCLQIKTVHLDPDHQKSQYLLQNRKIIQNITLLNKLKIFPYTEYIQRSKKYYSELLEKIPKNIWMFPSIHNMVKLQKILQNIIVPDQQQLQRVKKVMKTQHWRTVQQQSMIKVFCKQVLDQIYDDMIEYVDYLMSFENNKQNENLSLQNVFSLQQKRQLLKYLWELTKLLQKNISHEKQKYLSNIKYSSAVQRQVEMLDKKSYEQIMPSQKLLNRIVVIISDIKNYINPYYGNLAQIPHHIKYRDEHTIFKVINFRDHIFMIISQCFDNNSKYLNYICNKIQQSLSAQQQVYNQKLCNIVLAPTYKFPGTDKIKVNNIINGVNYMVDEQEERLTYRDLNNKYSHQLFKLAPSKQQFIRKFQQQFSNYVIPFTYYELNLTHQQYFINNIQNQSGYILSKNIQKMLHDVWRNGQMVYHTFGIMTCRILSQDWPQFSQSKFKLADQLLDIRLDAESQFLSKPENEKKKLRWIQQCGKIVMVIGGVQSTFSQLQASIIMLLSRSYRPLKQSQFKQVLQYTQDDMQAILAELSAKNVIIYNRDAGNYELNYDNKTGYQFEKKQKIQTKAQKKIIQKDYTYVIESIIARIMKRRKSVQKTDLLKLVSGQIKLQAHLLTVQQINNALERLRIKNIVNIEKTRGIIKYLQ